MTLSGMYWTKDNSLIVNLLPNRGKYKWRHKTFDQMKLLIFRWQFEDVKVEYSDRISKLMDGSLRIGSAEMNDTGSWTIIADNRLGQVARKQVALKVHPNQMPIEVRKRIFTSWTQRQSSRIIFGVIHKWRYSLEGQGFCDSSTKALVIKSVTMGEGVKNCPKLRDVIYGRPFCHNKNILKMTSWWCYLHLDY